MAFTPQLTTFDLDNVTIAYGPIIIDGFGDGDAAKFTIPDGFTDKVGIDGKVTRSKNLDESATIELYVMSSSASNDQLSAAYILDKKVHNGGGILPVYIRDNSGRNLFTGAQAWISKMPDVTIGREATVNTWVIRVGKLISFVGGN